MTGRAAAGAVGLARPGRRANGARRPAPASAKGTAVENRRLIYGIAIAVAAVMVIVAFVS